MQRNRVLAVSAAIVLIALGVGGLFASSASANTPFGQFGFGPWCTDADAWDSRSVTRGTVSAASATSVTITTSSGASHTFAINDQTHKRGSVAQNEQVFVVTRDDSTTASAVVNVNEGGRGPWGPGRWKD
jgi:hypothetical protein